MFADGHYEINPYEYLVDVLTKLPECETDEDYEKSVPGWWVNNDDEHQLPMGVYQ
ncbi:MAG: transposase domain-containing protein [Gammaproteobacteria bacterium]|nr:transposase domain-containing protein [Gammaproteobacteria bacterium]